jgi:hypothetical protein
VQCSTQDTGVRRTARRSTKGIGTVEMPFRGRVFTLPFYISNRSITVPAAPSLVALDDDRYDAMEDSTARNDKKILDPWQILQMLRKELYLVAQRFHFILG